MFKNDVLKFSECTTVRAGEGGEPEMLSDPVGQSAITGRVERAGPT